MSELKIIRGYPEYMRESIENVEKTRPQRVKKVFEAMSMSERDDVLHKFHPDYRPGGKRKVSIGVSKGEEAPNEIVDLIEAYPILDSSDIDAGSADYDVDILIIGGGGAGTVAALWATYDGIDPKKILITTKLRHGDANTMMAQGGIQVADRPNDSPPIHYLDTMGGGHFANKPKVLKRLVEEAPKLLKWHEDLGMIYDRNPDGTLMERFGGGTSRMRMHSSKDYTGMEIMRVIRDETRNLEIPVLEFCSAVELLTDNNGAVCGAVLWNMETKEYYVVKAKAVVMATGGWGRLHIRGFSTTNHYGATADGVIMAYRVGAALKDLDSAQYHPTGAAYPEQIVGLLITEKTRGMGAQPLNMNGEQFVFALEPRDVEAASFIRECYGRNLGIETPSGMKGVWLDSPLIEEIHGEGALREGLEAMYRMFIRFGVDMTQDPILVFPTLHYQNGGIEINEFAQVLHGNGKPIPGLFAGGEVTGGVHGKNRLMGNSLLGCNVFGKAAGMSAAKYVKSGAKPGKISFKHVEKYTKELKNANIKTEIKSPMILPEYRGKHVLARSIDIID